MTLPSFVKNPNYSFEQNVYWLQVSKRSYFYFGGRRSLQTLKKHLYHPWNPTFKILFLC